MSIALACTLVDRLMGLKRLPGFDGILILAPCDDIHTFTMRRPIDVAFVDGSGTVLAAWRGVPPRRRLRHAGAYAVAERYARDGPWAEPGDRLLAHFDTQKELEL